VRKLDKQVLEIIKTGNNEITQSYISELLGVSRMTVSRAIKRLKEAGAVTVKTNRTSGKFAVCFYAVHRVTPYHNNNSISIKINNLINKRIQRNKIQALLKTKSSLRSDYNQINVIKHNLTITSKEKSLLKINKDLPRHNTQKEIAKNLNWSPGKELKLVGKRKHEKQN
jgi:DNA-binding Lrp family transcriptional regulator